MQVYSHIPLWKRTTMNVGGPAYTFIEVHAPEEIEQAIDIAEHEGVPWIVLGGGSNIVFPDEGFRGVVIHIAYTGVTFTSIDAETVRAVIEGGHTWDAFVAEATARGLWGVENLSGIPGSAGAAPIQNIGAYGAEVSEVIEWVEVYDTDTRSFRTLSPEECAFGYRDSIFKHAEGKRFIVTRIACILSFHHAPRIGYADLAAYFAESEPALLTPEQIRAAVIDIRSRKMPDLTKWGTCGSFFQNPHITHTHLRDVLHMYPDLRYTHVSDEAVKVSAAWLIDNVGEWKGVMRNGAGVYAHHALTLVNEHGGARDVLAIARAIQDDIYTKTGITLIPEPHVVTHDETDSF